MHQAPLHSVGFVFHEFQRELEPMESNRALIGAGEKMEESEQWPQMSKTTWLFSKLHSLN